MDGSDYNTCNATFRSLTDQQRLMVSAIAGHIGPGETLELTSYGCGFGMFELALISAVPRESVWFQGIDTNAAAVARLRSDLSGVPKVRGHRVVTADMSSVDVSATEYGVFVQSLCYLGADEGMTVVKEARNRHRRLMITVTPLNRLNAGFAESLAASGVVRPLFAGTLAEELRRFGIDFASETIPARIRVPIAETSRRLVEFLTFARHQPWHGATSRAALLNAVAELGSVAEGEIVIAHPVELFRIG